MISSLTGFDDVIESASTIDLLSAMSFCTISGVFTNDSLVGADGGDVGGGFGTSDFIVLSSKWSCDPSHGAVAFARASLLVACNGTDALRPFGTVNLKCSVAVSWYVSRDYITYSVLSASASLA